MRETPFDEGARAHRSPGAHAPGSRRKRLRRSRTQRRAWSQAGPPRARLDGVRQPVMEVCGVAGRGENGEQRKVFAGQVVGPRNGVLQPLRTAGAGHHHILTYIRL